MNFLMRFTILFALSILISFIATFLYRKVARTWGWVDRPSRKKIHKEPIPTMGGICLFLVYWILYFTGIPVQNQMVDIGAIFASSAVILLTGIVDDLVELKPWQKMIGILLAANLFYFFTDIRLDHFTVSILGRVEFNQFGYVVMMLWIAAITNAVNLTDGLDGLAAGTSIISLVTMGLVSYFFMDTTNVAVVVMIFLLVGVLLGFLPHNFHPAKVFLGDTGALFIGFMIATLSLNGLKHATFISLLVPVAILGVPLTDTIAAIIRRKLHKKAISKKDWGHLHHRFLHLGFSHRQTVLVIYALGIIFSLTALLYPLSSVLGVVILTMGLLFGVILFILSFNLLDREETPLRTIFRKLSNNETDEENK
ncbi:glycosyltransferase family 4 protein [Jeotgalibaca caeni]|uniref:glycosyltransferase family 4 protein n=1 Tax=Jeotgalibaca caeni TaxID=3028623 RepID=UPI00237DCE73|nr:MraY family glycosyltransferase [Jeotgalibaca caeni]MDE1549721.1 MraY family glycosyltransferase [Jeotgalibaca caeni]